MAGTFDPTPWSRGTAGASWNGLAPIAVTQAGVMNRTAPGVRLPGAMKPGMPPMPGAGALPMAMPSRRWPLGDISSRGQVGEARGDGMPMPHPAPSMMPRMADGGGGGMPALGYAPRPQHKIMGGNPTLKPYAGVTQNAVLNQTNAPAFSQGSQDPNMSAEDAANWLHGVPPMKGYAEGGIMPPGVPAMVGERGREMAVPIGQFGVPGLSPGASLIAEGQRENVLPKPQMVGKEGPEIVVPQVPTMVIPNHVLPYIPATKQAASGLPPGVDPRAMRELSRSPQFAAMAWQTQQQDQRTQATEGKAKNEKSQHEADAVEGTRAAMKIAYPGAFTPEVEGALARMKPSVAAGFLNGIAGHLATTEKNKPDVTREIPGTNSVGVFSAEGQFRHALEKFAPDAADEYRDIPGTDHVAVMRGGKFLHAVPKSEVPREAPQPRFAPVPSGGFMYLDPKTGVPVESMGVFDGQTVAGPMKSGYQMPTKVYRKRETVKDERVMMNPVTGTPSTVVKDEQGKVKGLRTVPTLGAEGGGAATAKSAAQQNQDDIARLLGGR